MVDVELLLSDNGGVRIYPTEWHNTIYFGYQKNANIYRLHIVRSKVWQLIFPTETSEVIYVREFTNTRWGAWRHINTSA